MSESYYDSLVDCTLMIGINELSGIKYSTDSKLIPTYQQQILAAISSTVAIFPFSKTNYNYPPDEFKSNEQSSKKTVNKPDYKRQFSAEEFHIINDLVSHYNKTDIQNNLKNTDLQMSLNRRAPRFQNRRKSIKVISLDNYKGSLGSVSIETIKSFPGTYFNNNLKMSDKYVEPKIEVLPMTDNLGNRSYAFRLEFHRHFSMVSTSETANECNEIQVEPIFETDLVTTQDKFVPCNIVFFSKYPYFDLFKDILSQLFLSIANKTTTCIDEEILEYSAILTRIPIMKSGNIQIDFSINDITYSIKPNSLIFEQIIDWDMTILFQTLSLDDIVFVLTAMFQEQKIAFFSNHSNITTIICESLMILFQPFTWRHFYLTAVPSHLYDLIDAIVPFLIGLPLNMKERVIKCYDDIIVVDLDRGTIHKPKTCNIAQISSKLIVQLKDSLCERDWLVFRNRLSNLSYTSLKDLKSSQYEINKRFSEKIMLQFMMMMVDLFQEVLTNIIIEKKNDTLVANFDKYLATSNSDNVEFFKAVYRSDNFNGFLDSKLIKMDTDSWVKVCDNLYPDLMNLLRLQVPKERKSKSSTVKSERNIDIDLINEKTSIVVSLSTSKSVRNNYYLNTIEYLGRLVENIDVKKLKIDFYLQAGRQRKALELIQQLLLQDDASGLDISKIRKLVKGFDIKIVKEFKSLNSLLEIEVHLDKSGEERKPSVQQFNLPLNPIPKKEFYEVCKNADITQFEDVSDDLFKCLTLNQKSTKSRIKLVQPDLFKCFYYNWILSSSHLNGDDINFNQLIDEELIIISSGCVKVDEFGQGRILLTQMRLLFVPFGKTDITVMIDFSDEIVKKVKIDRRVIGLGKLTDVLYITKQNPLKKIVMWLTEEIDVWYNLVSEISVANRLSNEEKDKSIQDKMTDQCLVYENLTNCSTSNPYFKKYCLDISKIMLTHSTNQLDALKSGDQGATSHRKYLICKLMPSPKQVVTIDCAATIYKPIMKNSDLWCAIKYGERYFIKIFQVISENIQSLQSEEIEFKSRIKLMIHLKGTTKMVIGCIDGLIFLINSIDFKRQKIDIGSSEGIFPMCAICHHFGFNTQLVFIGTSNGQLLKCDQNFTQVEKIMTVPDSGVIHFMEIYDDTTLIMSSSHSIFIVTTNGEILSTIEPSNSKNIFNRISYFTVTNDRNSIIIGLSRLPVFIEYNISNLVKPICGRMKNLVTNKDFSTMVELADMSEHFSKFVGLSSILSIENHNDLWMIFKDGTVEVRNSTSLEKIDKFRAHDGILAGWIKYEYKNKIIVFTIGDSDGKVILWNWNPS